MLTELTDYLNNHFVVQNFVGDFVLSENQLLFPLEKKPKINQYIYLVSTLNGAVCKVISITNDVISLESDIDLLDDNVQDIYFLSIPSVIIKKSIEIKDFKTKNTNATYISESFGGWSGTKATGKNGVIKWTEYFNDDLKSYKRFFSDVARG